MKIAICSDLHLEFGGIDLKNTESADVLILSGDICIASKMGAYKSFFETVSDEFPLTLMVMGNHEHYNGDFAKSASLIKTALEDHLNVHLLDKEIYVHNDITFVGATLWTDMNKDDDLTKMHLRSVMNDFRIVYNSNKVLRRKVPLYKRGEDGAYLHDDKNQLIMDRWDFKEEHSTFSPDDAFEDHKKAIEYINVIVEGKHEQKFVVIGHHAPSKLSTHPRYADEYLMNGGYSSNLNEFIMDRPQIKLWTHGHTHEEFDYMIGDTRIVCNPRGYIKYEPRAANFKLKVVEV